MAAVTVHEPRPIHDLVQRIDPTGGDDPDLRLALARFGEGVGEKLEGWTEGAMARVDDRPWRWLFLEQGSLVVLSLILGTLVGLVLAALILPLISITQGGATAVPAPVVIVPVGSVAGLEAAVVATLALIVAILAITLRRLGLGSMLRMGDD